jgi:hypothetical protein
MLRPLATAMLLLGMLSIPALASGSPAPEAAPIPPKHVYIDGIVYNFPGPDRPITNRKLNHEVVVIVNGSQHIRNLRGWTLHDRKADGHVYTFPRTRVLPLHAVGVRTGSGTNDRHNRYWGLGNYVWNNTGARARLYNRRHQLVATCTYTGDDPSGVTQCNN